ncbi:putative autotransporter adhesin-like protein [Nitrospirillum amazonense]|uniref:Putative autotransporter adhesin-like protein n=1 Tax=Nitrospirillum amazonense TaxID=28077 RepID=A0A560JBZ2_9PROT|nr:DUF2807 domain-containing protein [Nitrospirillum amazonense]TWB68009.1 putative autotransporter adhesin-like protein [Nitrospirillum amazonense]
MSRSHRIALALPLSLAAFAAAGAASGTAWAGERSWALEGQALRITTPCARTVDITASSSARDVHIQATADDPNELDQLTASGGQTAQLGISGRRCYREGDDWKRWQPTLRIAITVPAGVPLEVQEGGSTDYQASGGFGALALTIDGSGNFKADRVAGGAQVRIHGSGDTQLDRLEGALKVRVAGSGNVGIIQMTGPSIDLDSSGSGTITIGGGSGGSTQAKLSGSGNVTLPTVQDLRLTIDGSGDLVVAKAQGALSAHLGGSGALTIHAVSATTAQLKQSGNGDITIDGGEIGTLSSAISGSGDQMLRVKVTDATLSLSGSGDVKIDQVTGRLDQSHSGSGSVHVGGR